MPSLPPRRRSPRPRSCPRVIEYEMSIPCANGPARRRSRSRWIITCAEADVDPVQLRADDADVVELDAACALDVDPVLAADHGQVLDRDAVGAHDDPAADDRARLADEHLLAA